MRRPPTTQLLILSLLPAIVLPTIAPAAIALPPPEDLPEEVLRSQVITGARSPIDGRPLTAAEYAELQAELATSPPSQTEVAPQVRRVVNLLKLRKFLKTVFPFIPIR